ncbi:MAG: tripartite tricarboxylate transporter substrate binding protein [Eubacteriales bacterium]|nr:tripartite tricarboxylate transporter substrate binding protein [Eubacteriales bacterium]
MKRRVLGVVAAGVLAASMLTGCGSSNEGGLPKTIEVQVPAKAGGGTDVMARALTTKIAKDAGINMNVVNNTDGNGVVAMETIRTAKPDGSKILQFHTTMLIKSATGVYDKTAADDFKIIGVSQGTEKAQYTLVVPAESGMTDLQQFLDKAASAEVKIGVETGGTSHIMAGLFAQAAGIQAKFVEAGSDTEKLTALVGGTIDAALVNVNQAKQYVESGKANALAVVSNGEEGARSTVLPDVPSMQEQGVDCTFTTLNLFCGPKDMSDELAKQLYDYYAAAAASDEVNEILQPAGMAMEFVPYEEGLAKVQEQQADINSVVETLGLKQK